MSAIRTAASDEARIVEQHLDDAILPIGASLLARLVETRLAA